MNPTLADLALMEEELAAYEATLENEPEEDLDPYEALARRNNTLREEFDGVRVSFGGTVGAARLA